MKSDYTYSFETTEKIVESMKSTVDTAFPDIQVRFLKVK